MATASQENRGVQDQFELVLRLQQSRNSQPADAELGSSSAHALVHDVLKARLQVEAQASDENYVHACGFNNLGKALAAGRALQLAFEGFRRAAPASRAHISVVLDAPGPQELPTGPSVEQKDLLALAKPSQVLITQALYNRIAHAQPVALRSFPACAGVYEFLWTSVERLDELRAEGEFTPTLVVDPAPAVMEVQETMISYPAPRFSEATAYDMVRPPVVERPVAPVYEEDEERSRPVGKILGWSALAAVLIAGCGLAVWRLVNPVVPPNHVVVTTPSPTPPPVPYDLQTPAEPKPEPPRPKQRTVIEPSAKLPPPAPTPRSAKCLIETYDIPQYLNLADKNRNHGDYDAAEREYLTVLGCQPGNRAARDGLARLRGH